MGKKVIKTPDIVLRKICDEFLLIPIKNIINDNYILRLNKAGAYIWEIMEKVDSICEIKYRLKNIYGADYEVEKDLEEFLKKLEKLKLIKIENFI